MVGRWDLVSGALVWKAIVVVSPATRKSDSLRIQVPAGTAGEHQPVLRLTHASVAAEELCTRARLVTGITVWSTKPSGREDRETSTGEGLGTESTRRT
jgi:hypothetical protein